MVSGWRQVRSDCCVFTRVQRDASNKATRLISMIVVFVGDLLWIAEPSDWLLLIRALNKPEIGPVATLSKTTPIYFLGVQIIFGENRCIGLHMNAYIDETQEVRMAEIIRKDQFFR